jgi:CDP-paratose 2-epimerase
VQSNLIGAYHCLALARLRQAQFVFLSTSRVYPVATLESLNLVETELRFELAAAEPFPGASSAGIAESFPLSGARTLYGATRLAAELLIEEYRDAYGCRAVINRCGWSPGPGRWARSTRVSSRTGFSPIATDSRCDISASAGPEGRSAILHVEDLVELVDEQVSDPVRWDGVTVKRGGGRAGSLSLLETTALCAEITGHAVAVQRSDETRPGDLPLYSDCSRLFELTDWRRRRGPREILADIDAWASEHAGTLASALN